MKRSNLAIYKIENKINGKVYIGQTANGLRQRISGHLERLRRGERDHRIYAAMRKYGIGNFEFSQICTVLERSDLDIVEMQLIKEHNSYKNGYNCNEGGKSVSKETRKKLSRIFKGRKITWADKIVKSRLANQNRRHPRDYVAKGADSNMAKSYLIEFPDGSSKTITGIRHFCKNNGLTHSNLFATRTGGQNHHRGYRILKTFNDYPEGVHRKRLAVEMAGGQIGS